MNIKITVTCMDHEDGSISFFVHGPHKDDPDAEVYACNIGMPQEESFNWAAAMSGIVVKGLLETVSPFSETNKRKAMKATK
jgi:hypothetical protein